MSLDMAKVRLTDAELVAAVHLPGTKIPIHVLATERKGADAATKRAVAACIAELLERTDYFFEDHVLVSRALGDTAGDWQQALDGKE